MVRKALGTITSKISGLREAAFWLALFALFSQILALVRDRLLAHHFGAGVELDIYYAAFKIPDLLFVTVASLVSISALVPLFARKETEGEHHLKAATDSIFTIFGISIVVSVGIAFFLMPWIVKTAFGGLSLFAQKETINLSRILLLSPLFLGFSNFFGAIVQYQRRFILYSLSPLLYNAGIIVGLVFWVNSLGITAAVIGVVIGALLHLALPALFIRNSTARPHFVLKIKWRDVLETMSLSIPRTLALSITSFVGFIFVALASRLSSGSIAVFNLSWNLQSAPLSLIGASLSLAAFPALAVSAAKNHTEEIIDKISDGLRQIIFWSLPFTALLIVLRAHIVRVILGSGNFSWADTRLTAAALALFIISTVFQSMMLFLSRSHYALGKTKRPLLGNLLAGLISVLLAIGLLRWASPDFTQMLANWLRVDDLTSTILYLPLSFSVGALFGSLLLFFSLGRNLYGQIWRNIKGAIANHFLAALGSGAGALLILRLSDGWFDLNTFWGVLGHGTFAGIAGIATGILVLYLLKDEEYKKLLHYRSH